MSLPEEFIDILCCPKRLCRGDLITLDKKDKQILKCQNCNEEYEIIEDIPILFPNIIYSQDAHKRHYDDEAAAKSYAKKYDSYLKKEGSPWGLYTHVSEIRAIKKLTESIDLTGKTILDCGCGNGRLLSCYPEAKMKVGIDTSLFLLQAAKKREPNFFFVCGQLEDMPFKDCIADFSVSVRVFQHLKAPEHAFAEMVRVTHPSGYVALELYNKLNPKELYKRFRMLKFIQKIRPWGLSYDRYYSFREIEKWCRDNFIKPLKYSGAGWGLHFYFFDLIKFRRFAPDWLQKIVFNFFLFLEEIIGTWPFFSKTLEKVCVIGSLQGIAKKKNYFIKIRNYLQTRKDIKRAAISEIVLNDRNYCFVSNEENHLRLIISWLKIAQEATPDAGISRGWSFVRSAKSNEQGWQPSYPETTGYIIPTIIQASKFLNDQDLLRRAKLMADWELKVMFTDGAVHGGNICVKPNRAIFDTGQVIRGLHAIYKQTGQKKYLEAAIKSSQWVLNNETNKEGRWIENNASSVNPYTTTYNIYAIVPIVELGIEIGNNDFKDVGLRAGDFTLKMQNSNGWFDGADFAGGKDSLLHTLAYTIDGLWDTGKLLNEEKFLSAARHALDGALSAMDEKGKIPGRLNERWEGMADWACLTGIAQIGITAMKLYEHCQDKKYLLAAIKIKEFLKACQNNNQDSIGGGKGAIWGSWPISGGYGQYEALNWAAKFFADLLMLVIKSEE